MCWFTNVRYVPAHDNQQKPTNSGKTCCIADSQRWYSDVLQGSGVDPEQALSLDPPIGCWRAWVAGLMPGWGRVGPSGVCWGVWGWGWGAFWVVDAGFVWGRQFRGVSFSLRVRAGRGAWL